MADQPAHNPYKRAQPGDVLEIAASVWNMLLERLGPVLNGRSIDDAETSTEILVRNDTGADLADEFGILQIGAPIVTSDEDEADFKSRRAVVGTTPATGSPFAVLREPAADGAIVRATFRGVTPCMVNLSSVTHRFARPTTSTAELESAARGPVQILWTASEFVETGSQWALVDLGGNGASGEVVWVSVLSTTEVGGAQRAVSLDNTGRPADWPVIDSGWAQAANGGTLSIRKYLATRNGADHLGSPLWDVDDCCAEDPPDPAGVCNVCTWPADMCVTVTLDNGACSQLPASFTGKIVNVGSPCPYYVGWISPSGEGITDPDLAIYVLVRMDELGVWSIHANGGSCSTHCSLFIDSVHTSAFDCADLTFQLTGTIGPTHQPPCLNGCAEDCLDQPVTIDIEMNYGACPGGGIEGSAPIQTTMCAAAVEPTLYATFAVTAGTGLGLDGSTVAMTWLGNFGGTNVWRSQDTLGGAVVYVTLSINSAGVASVTVFGEGATCLDASGGSTSTSCGPPLVITTSNFTTTAGDSCFPSITFDVVIDDVP